MAKNTRELTKRRYDLLVVGAGIAGCEAAWQAAGSGCRVLLLDMSLDRMNMPAHLPALFVGPRGMDVLYGQLEGTLFVKALEASFMGCYEVPDARKKILLFDKREHSLVSKDLLERKNTLDARQAMIASLEIEGDIYVKSIFDEVFSAKTAAISPGSYIKGRIRTGNLEMKAGRYGDLSADDLEKSLRENGVKLVKWQGTIPETLDVRGLNTEKWEEAKEVESPFSCPEGGFLETKREKRPVLWRRSGRGYQLLLPAGRRSCEAYLYQAGEQEENTWKSQGKALVRRETTQESLNLLNRGENLPESVAFTGSFAGAMGYLDCVMEGRERTAELLERNNGCST